MIIDYIYIEGYEQIISSINLNFGGPIKYRYENNTIKSYKNEYFIRDFYMEKNCIKQISAIIGKNSSGKTTILRIINMIFSHLQTDFKYVLIYRNDYGKYYITNIKGVKIGFSLKEIKKSKRNYIENVKIIYFSSIFDKSNRMLENYRLEDISSNTLLRNYVNDYFKNQIDYLGISDKSDELLEKIKRKNIDVINEFRKSESMLRLKYFNEIGKLTERSKFKSLFKSPIYINISYADDSVYKLDKFTEIRNYLGESELEKEILTNLTEINNIIDEIIFSSNEFLDESELKRKYKNEFLGMLIFEFFSILLLKYDFDIVTYTSMFLDLLYKKEDYEYDVEEVFLKLTEKIKYHYTDIQVDYNDDEYTISDLKYEQNDSIEKLQYVYNKNDQFIYSAENMDSSICNYIISEILEKMESIEDEEIYRINNLLNIEETEIEQKNDLGLIGNIVKDTEIDKFNTINYLKDKGKNIDYIITNLKLIYKDLLNEIEEDYYEEILEEHIDRINYINSQLLA
jgi:ABC-type Na+ transport system, ATPase component